MHDGDATLDVLVVRSYTEMTPKIYRRQLAGEARAALEPAASLFDFCRLPPRLDFRALGRCYRGSHAYARLICAACRVSRATIPALRYRPVASKSDAASASLSNAAWRRSFLARVIAFLAI